jgi:hypothetical protein
MPLNPWFVAVSKPKPSKEKGQFRQRKASTCSKVRLPSRLAASGSWPGPGVERMFFEVGQAVDQSATTAAPMTKEEIEKLLVVAPRYGIEIRLPHQG